MNSGPTDICDPKQQTYGCQQLPAANNSLVQSVNRDPQDNEFAREKWPNGPRTLHLGQKSSHEQK